MKKTLVMTVATSALLAASSAFAGGRCGGCCPHGDDPSADDVQEVICPDRDSEDGVMEVVQDEEMQDGDRRRGGDRGERGERGDRGERGERGDRANRGGRLVQMLLRGTEPTEEQAEEIRGVMQAAGEAAREVMQAAREASQEGEEVDREAVRAEIVAIQQAVPGQVRDLLTEAQQETFDANLAAHEERLAEREAERAERGEGEEGEEGDRQRRGRRGQDGQRGRDSDRPRGPRGGDDELELG